MGGGLQDPNVARRIANGAPELARHLKAEFARAAQDVANKTQKKILEADAPKYPDRGLREEIAATVQVRGVKRAAGVQAQIRSYGPLMPEGKHNLAAYANAGTRRWARWRHPVFGTEAQLEAHLAAGGQGGHGRGWTWVTQEWPSARGWFDDTVRGEAQHFSDAVQKAIDETQRYLEGRL